MKSSRLYLSSNRNLNGVDIIAKTVFGSRISFVYHMTLRLRLLFSMNIHVGSITGSVLIAF